MDAVPKYRGIPHFEDVPIEEIPLPPHPRQDILDTAVKLWSVFSAEASDDDGYPDDDYVAFAVVLQGGEYNSCVCSEDGQNVADDEHKEYCVWKSNRDLKKLPGFLMAKPNPSDHTELHYYYSLGEDRTEFDARVEERHEITRFNQFVKKKQLILKHGFDPTVVWYENNGSLLNAYDQLKDRLENMREEAERARLVVAELDPLRARIEALEFFEDDYTSYLAPDKVQVVKDKVEEYNRIEQRDKDIDSIREEVYQLPDDSKIKQALLSEKSPATICASHQFGRDYSGEYPVLDGFLASLHSSPIVLNQLMNEIAALFDLDSIIKEVGEAAQVVNIYDSSAKALEVVTEKLGVSARTPTISKF